MKYSFFVNYTENYQNCVMKNVLGKMIKNLLSFPK